MAKSRLLFSQNAPSYNFDTVLNTSVYFGPINLYSILGIMSQKKYTVSFLRLLPFTMIMRRTQNILVNNFPLQKIFGSLVLRPKGSDFLCLKDKLTKKMLASFSKLPKIK